jgi:hypothetical protein
MGIKVWRLSLSPDETLTLIGPIASPLKVEALPDLLALYDLRLAWNGE